MAAEIRIAVQSSAARTEALRGQGLGRQVMNAAEEWAREKGLVGIWLDAFDFQARPFYERQGYRLFATLEDYPPGQQRFFLRKPLRP